MKTVNVAENGGDLTEDCGILAEDADEAILMEEVGREIWLDDHNHNHGHGHGHEDDDLIVHHDTSMFYGDLPTLPDFSCISSSSSTSPAPVNAIVSSASSSSAASSSTSSAASWAMLRSDGEEPTQNQNQYGSGKCDVESSAALQSTASMKIPLETSQGFGCGEGGGDCIDMMGTFGYMDLLNSNEFFDTSAIFSQDDDTQKPNLMDQTLDEVVVPMMDNSSGGDMQMMNSSLEQDEDLAAVFLEWLKNNKETVSAEDLRKVKIKKATIESAARHLGGGKEAMKQLLKLILEWVKTNHLQRRRNNSTTNNNISYQQDPFQNPNNNLIPPSMPAPNYPQPQEYLPLLESPPSPQSGAMPHQQQFAMPPNSQYSPHQRLLRLCSSATKEARKKRMARQRRCYTRTSSVSPP